MLSGKYVLIVRAESVCDVSPCSLGGPHDLHDLVVLQPVVPRNGVRQLDAGQLGGLQSEMEGGFARRSSVRDSVME